MNNDTAIAKLRDVIRTIDWRSREQILDIINRYEMRGEMAEIGTLNGTFAYEILARTAIAKLYCVDPYVAYSDFKDGINQKDIDSIYRQATGYLSVFGERVAFLRDFSDKAALTVADGSLDWVYIDGNHQSAFVLADLNAWWPKVRDGGLVIGDDCVDFDEGQRNLAGDITIVHSRLADGTPDAFGDYGVFDALRRFTDERALGYELLDAQFVIPK